MTAVRTAILLFVAFFIGAAYAANTSPPADPAREAENKEVSAALKRGPADVAMRDQAVLHLPKDYAFVPQKEAAILLRRMGNFPNDRLIGLIFPSNGENWFIGADFDDSGYVKDDDGKDIDAAALLQNLRNATEQDNNIRREKGEKELEITGWIEPPHYDKASHHLVWSIGLKEKGTNDEAHSNVNYNTYALGRGGYISLDLVTNRATVEKDKAHVREVLSDLSFNQGKRYEDFNVKTDKIAEFGLLALIGGLAVKKLGLLALAAAFLVKGAKLIAVACVAVLAGVRRFFGRGKAKPVPALASATAPPDARPPGSDLRG
jgi:uncharacterized membrane-anchored protein